MLFVVCERKGCGVPWGRLLTKLSLAAASSCWVADSRAAWLGDRESWRSWAAFIMGYGNILAVARGEWMTWEKATGPARTAGAGENRKTNAQNILAMTWEGS